MPPVDDVARHVVSPYAMPMVVLPVTVMRSKVMCIAVVATRNVVTAMEPVIVIVVSRRLVVPVVVVRARGHQEARREG
jgi:hypothetical protein